jgi:hypothetical protein
VTLPVATSRAANSVVADVVVGAAFDQVRLSGQDRRGPVQGLDLGLLVDREHDRVLGRVEVEPDDVDDLGFQFGIGGEPEALGAPRLHAVLAPDARHGVIGDLQVPGQQPARPVRDAVLLRRRRQRHRDHLRPVDPARAPRPVLVVQACDALGLIPVPPGDHRRARHPDPVGDRRVRDPIRGQQDNSGPQRQTRRRPGRAGQTQQFLTVTVTKQQRGRRTIRHAPIVPNTEASNN